jgi:hypothetical protein
MTTPRDNYWADLMQSVDVDLTTAVDDGWNHHPNHEPHHEHHHEPHPEPPNESGPIFWEPGPHHEPPNESGPIFWDPAPGPYEGDDPGPGGPGPADDPGPNPDEGWDPGVPIEPQPGEYPEDKNCWEVPDVDDDPPPSEPIPDEIDCTTGSPEEQTVHGDEVIV